MSGGFHLILTREHHVGLTYRFTKYNNIQEYIT